jgi:hypothetical protein
LKKHWHHSWCFFIKREFGSSGFFLGEIVVDDERLTQLNADYAVLKAELLALVGEKDLIAEQIAKQIQEDRNDPETAKRYKEINERKTVLHEEMNAIKSQLLAALGWC